MQPISEFKQLMNQRTLQAVQATEQTALLLRYVFIALGLLLIFMLWRLYRTLHSTLGCSVDELQKRIVRLGQGDLSVRIPVPQGMGNSVLGWLSVTQANLARIDAERKQAEENVRQLAFYDSLTNLPNRRLFSDRFEQAMLASKRSGCYGALMVLDLDNFKQLNDTYGHVVGDLLLIEVAHRLKGCVRELDTVVRFGGDEFIVMLVDLDVDSTEAILQAESIAEKIRSKLSNVYQLTIRNDENADTKIEYQCTASIGVVMFIKNEKAASEDDFFRYADAAMYQAKAAGRNSIRFSTLNV
jgi:diguanylate cyclase (GGDEF)-like protein